MVTPWPPHLVDGSLPIPGLEVDRCAGIRYHRRLVILCRIEGGLFDAPVESQADDDHPLAATLLEHSAQGRWSLLTGHGIAHREPRIAVLAVGAVLDDGTRDFEAGVELRPPSALDAVHRPDASVLLEVRGRLGVPVLGVDNEGAGRHGPHHFDIDSGDDSVSTLDEQASVGVGEVVLHVYNDESGACVVADHVRQATSGQ